MLPVLNILAHSAHGRFLYPQLHGPHRIDVVFALASISNAIEFQSRQDIAQDQDWEFQRFDGKKKLAPRLPLMRKWRVTGQLRCPLRTYIFGFPIVNDCTLEL